MSYGKEKEESFGKTHGFAEQTRAGTYEPAGDRYVDNTSGTGEGVIILTDPTMNGTKDPARKARKLKERIAHLESEMDRMKDQIEIMQHEIGRLLE